MYGQSTSGSTQPAERPATAHSGDVLSARQHSMMGHVTEEENLLYMLYMLSKSFRGFQDGGSTFDHSNYCSCWLYDSLYCTTKYNSGNFFERRLFKDIIRPNAAYLLTVCRCCAVAFCQPVFSH